jgi:hypothetical protein
VAGAREDVEWTIDHAGTTHESPKNSSSMNLVIAHRCYYKNPAKNFNLYIVAYRGEEH